MYNGRATHAATYRHWQPNDPPSIPQLKQTDQDSISLEIYCLYKVVKCKMYNFQTKLKSKVCRN